MTIFRVERNKSYTIMSNHHLRNKGLSLKAKELLSQMLSLPEDWDYTLAGRRLCDLRAAARCFPGCLVRKKELLYGYAKIEFILCYTVFQKDEKWVNIQ